MEAGPPQLPGPVGRPPFSWRFSLFPEVIFPGETAEQPARVQRRNQPVCDSELPASCSVTSLLKGGLLSPRGIYGVQDKRGALGEQGPGVRMK